ncbi:MAG: phage portal protein [Propionivibrio sp.]|nr:phage portal protein [Propionivibrio sp.]MBP8789261.1 phage portal protein [Azonexus sp.]
MFEGVKNVFGLGQKKPTRALTPSEKSVSRTFAAARPGRLNDGWTTMTTSADMESVTSLTALRNRSRALVRDNCHAKRAREVVTNNVIGMGIGLQAAVQSTRGNLATAANDAIETAWADWCKADACHIGGALHFADIERLLLSEVFEAGDVFIRIHRQGRGAVPMSLEVIEAERLADEWEAPSVNGNLVRQGVECDAFNRPVAYWIHEYHPGDPRRPMVQDRLLRIPASEIIHLCKVDRWPQVRGVPWMHAGMSRLHQLGEFEDAAVVAARIGAEKVMVLKETEDGRFAETVGEQSNDGTLTWNSGKGQVDILPAGTDIAPWSPNYPDNNFDPFVRAALRDIAAAFGMSYESLSRDYSQSNYSSSRMGLLDDRDGWRVLQQWYIRSFRARLHDAWLEAAVYARAIKSISVADYVARPAYYRAVSWKPRGWSWVDPTKEVAAYKEAEKAGYITKGDVIAQTSSNRDIEDVIRERRRELDMLAAASIDTDTDPNSASFAAQKAAPAAPTADNSTDTPDTTPAQDAANAASQPRLYAFKRDYE